ncbi:NAD(P)-dependent oxidoreductase [Tabrizicola sp. TH137]|uniref:SDR family oxidoreductase n=1 Tax=Tabrizicola sp. TH137 TaxID=2067452 RepID=UPI000C7B70E8|nr:SDR family oxidoreductase [Tabrizicola sp. TH137]PLL14434.1 NAD(P)-dependent oxidoreductase [Tabrizicola sp. TH137]
MTGLPLLITGGTGLLGLHWAAARRETQPVTLALHRRRIALPGTTARPLNLADPHDLDAAMTEDRIACIIHTAGLTSVERCEQDPEAAHHHNVTLAATVAAAAERAGAALIHISTDHLFDGRADLYDEDSPATPVNVYGQTKARAEEAVLRAHPRALVLRTNFYGWGPSHRPSFSDWLLTSLRQDRPLRLFTDMRYTPTHITPLIEAAMALSAKGASGIVNAVGDEALSKHAFGLRLADHFGLSPARIEPARLADQPDLVRRPLSMALSTRRLHALLGHGLGGIDAHLDLLRAQEETPAITEIRSL